MCIDFFIFFYKFINQISSQYCMKLQNKNNEYNNNNNEFILQLHEKIFLK